MAARTLCDKLHRAHAVREEEDCLIPLYIDCQLVHEVTSPQAFEKLRLTKRDFLRSDSIVWPTTAFQSESLITSLRVNLVGQYARKLKICAVDFTINNHLVTRVE